MGNPYHAKSAVVYLSTSGTGNASQLVGCSEWTLDMSVDTVDVTAFGDTNKVYVQGLPDVSGTLSGFTQDGETKWFDASASTDGCKLYLYFTSLDTSRYAYGPAWFSVSMNNSSTSANEISANFVAKGAWKVKSA